MAGKNGAFLAGGGCRGRPSPEKSLTESAFFRLTNEQMKRPQETDGKPAMIDFTRIMFG